MKLIPLDAVLAEIEKKIKQYEVAFNNPSFASYEASLIAKGKYRKLLDIRQFIDTLEVKEVDLEKEYIDYIDCDDGHTKFDIAKHFFELGLKAQEECHYLTFKDAEKSIVNQARKELCDFKTQKGEKV